MNIGNLFFNRNAAKPAAEKPQVGQAAAPKANTNVFGAAQNDSAEVNWDDEIFQKLYPNDNGGFMG